MSHNDNLPQEPESSSFSLTGFFVSALAVLAVGLMVRRLLRSDVDED